VATPQTLSHARLVPPRVGDPLPTPRPSKKARRLQIALRQQLAPLRVSQLLQAIIAHGPAFPFARAMGYQAALPRRRRPRPKGPILMGPDSVASRQRSDRQIGATADGPGEGEPRGCQSRPSRESWLRPSRTSTSSTSRNATSSSIGVIGPLLRVVRGALWTGSLLRGDVRHPESPIS
jgi:hypothetical protein